MIKMADLHNYPIWKFSQESKFFIPKTKKTIFLTLIC